MLDNFKEDRFLMFKASSNFSSQLWSTCQPTRFSIKLLIKATKRKQLDDSMQICIENTISFELFPDSFELGEARDKKSIEILSTEDHLEYVNFSRKKGICQ